jgi:hypothetical protein
MHTMSDTNSTLQPSALFLGGSFWAERTMDGFIGSEGETESRTASIRAGARGLQPASTGQPKEQKANASHPAFLLKRSIR